MHLIDWLVIGGYFFALILVVWWSSKRQDTTEDYFLAGRNIGWFAVGASLFASNIGSEHIVGLAGQGTSSGMAMAHWELHAWIMIMLGWVFVPYYYRSGVYTMPEFLERRFNSTARWILSIVSLFAYVVTKVSVTIYAGAMVFETLLPDMSLNIMGTNVGPFWIGAIATVVLTGIYTIFGGLRAVLYTDTAQAIILLVGSFFITFFGLSKLGGWGELVSTCKANADQFALWRPMSDPDFPWLGILIASPVVGIWYWCTDQYIVQRTLAAKNLRNARRGAIWGGFLKVWPVMIFLVPGLIGYALHQKGVDGFSIPTEDGVIKGDMVFPTMVSTLLPIGLRGLVVGGLLAALMSSLSSLFNSCAALFTVDIYKKLHPTASEKMLVHIGRVATGVIVVLGLLWIPIMPLIAKGGLYKYLQSVQGYLAPPITAVFLLGLFCKRINGKGAVAGLAVGFIAGMAKLTIQGITGAALAAQKAFEKGEITELSPWTEKILSMDCFIFIGGYNFLYASGWLMAISVIVVVVVSLMTKPPLAAQIENLTYSTATEKQRKENRASWNKWDVMATAVVLSLVLGLYLYFSFWLK
ncbi:MAG: sodium:solute symporter [Sedimentisphaerales bacterium]|nr:sodium:solute symporter [Sedimentisphaerales bacterium]